MLNVRYKTEFIFDWHFLADDIEYFVKVYSTHLTIEWCWLNVGWGNSHREYSTIIIVTFWQKNVVKFNIRPRRNPSETAGRRMYSHRWKRQKDWCCQQEDLSSFRKYKQRYFLDITVFKEGKFGITGTDWWRKECVLCHIILQLMEKTMFCNFKVRKEIGWPIGARLHTCGKSLCDCVKKYAALSEDKDWLLNDHRL